MDYEGGYSDGANDGYLSGNADKNLCVRYSSDDDATMNNKTKSINNVMAEVIIRHAALGIYTYGRLYHERRTIGGYCGASDTADTSR